MPAAAAYRPQPFARITRQLVTAYGLRSVDTARVLAMLCMSGADGLISTWNDKERFDVRARNRASASASSMAGKPSLLGPTGLHIARRP